MKPPYYDTMASGQQCIVLEDGINYDSFAEAAERWSKRLDLSITDHADSVSERLWSCEKDGKKFWLAWDDWFPTISIEPCDSDAGSIIPVLGSLIDAQQKHAEQGRGSNLP